VLRPRLALAGAVAEVVKAVAIAVWTAPFSRIASAGAGDSLIIGSGNSDRAWSASRWGLVNGFVTSGIA